MKTIPLDSLFIPESPPGAGLIVGGCNSADFLRVLFGPLNDCTPEERTRSTKPRNSTIKPDLQQNP